MGDETCLLQDPHRDRHTRAAHTKHRGQKLLGEIEAIVADAVLRHEEPARATLLDDMQAIAGRRLGDGLEHELAVTVKQQIERLTFLGELAKIGGGQSP